MNLIKEKWNKNDVMEFQAYLKTFENNERKEWATNLLKTSLPVLCIKTIDIKNIVHNIYKGNYLSFLDLMIWEYYENTAINGFLINQINEFDKKIKYLDIYSKKCDNWATCDLLKFNIKGKEKQYFDLSTEYVKSKEVFRKRIGLLILFEFINKEYIKTIFDIISSLKDETDYYVNMMNAWLLSECFIKERESTLNYLNNNELNKFTINKTVQKCRESRRVSEKDKEMLLKYKKK